MSRRMGDYPIPPAPSGLDSGTWVSMVEQAREFCGWHIAPEVEETITVDGSGTAVQFLPTLRMVALTSITNDGETVSDPEWSEAGFIRASRWTCKLRGVTATLTHGFSEWPHSLSQVLTELAAAAARGGVQQVSSGSHQVSFDASLRSDQRATLDRYRLRDLR